MSKDNSGPAFPSDPDYVTSWEGGTEVTAIIKRDGMTKRELIAMHVISGLVVGRSEVVSVFAREAVIVADALLSELAKE